MEPEEWGAWGHIAVETFIVVPYSVSSAISGSKECFFNIIFEKSRLDALQTPVLSVPPSKTLSVLELMGHKVGSGPLNFGFPLLLHFILGYFSIKFYRDIQKWRKSIFWIFGGQIFQTCSKHQFLEAILKSDQDRLSVNAIFRNDISKTVSYRWEQKLLRSQYNNFFHLFGCFCGGMCNEPAITAIYATTNKRLDKQNWVPVYSFGILSLYPASCQAVSVGAGYHRIYQQFVGLLAWLASALAIYMPLD